VRRIRCCPRIMRLRTPCIVLMRTPCIVLVRAPPLLTWDISVRLSHTHIRDQRVEAPSLHAGLCHFCDRSNSPAAAGRQVRAHAAPHAAALCVTNCSMAGCEMDDIHAVQRALHQACSQAAALSTEGVFHRMLCRATTCVRNCGCVCRGT